jgi:branched-chain amino acid transport system substrate-binding protein
MVDDKGRQTHDLTWGPGYLTALGVQWQNGKKMGVWPNHWVAAKGAPPVTYSGIVPYKIPPWVLKAYKK